MSVRVQVSEVIDRPVPDVFHFYAHDHVRNHPRWDRDMELEKVSEGPIGVGTVIRRRNSHSGTPVEAHGRATFEALGHDKTTLKISVELPGMDESMDTSLLTSLMERSVRNMKDLIESEV